MIECKDKSWCVRNAQDPFATGEQFLSSLAEPCGRLIGALGHSHMPDTLAALLRHVAATDFIVIFGYRGFSRPLALFDDFPPDRNDLHVADYIEGPYLLDPFFLASLAPARTGFWRMSEVAPDRFFQSEYFDSYYKQTGLAEEIAFLVEIGDGTVVVVSLMRLEKRFSAVDVRKLAALWPIVESACKHQWSDLSHTAEVRGRDAMLAACRQLGDGALTGREGEVAALTLQGHSAAAIGRTLGISAGTARIHRQNIYAKLRIGSQAELFSAFRAVLFPLEAGGSRSSAPGNALRQTGKASL